MAKQRIVLVVDIWRDIQQYIVTYLLLLLVVLSAFAVIYFTHLNRQTTNQVEMLLAQRDELDIEFRNLLLEQSSLTESSDIENKARKLLKMQRPTPDTEVIVRLP
ncbi:MAG: cell division protein FtsL [Alteromonadaceae bacterium]|nr:cell division protein FtsL [Alteromonadaceae bacterium]PCI62940.1 MAG: cell division protein FtsL [Gammaproteobacteria bacterium]